MFSSSTEADNASSLPRSITVIATFRTASLRPARSSLFVHGVKGTMAVELASPFLLGSGTPARPPLTKAPRRWRAAFAAVFYCKTLAGRWGLAEALRRRPCHVAVAVGSAASAALLPAPATARSVGKSARPRWLAAFAVIRSCRAFLTVAGNRVTDVLHHRRPSYVALDIRAGDEQGAATIAVPCSAATAVLDLEAKLSLVKREGRLVEVVKGKSVDGLRRLGGVEEIATSLASNTESGINVGEGDSLLLLRRKLFGSNTYNKPPARGFMSFVSWKAFKVDPMLFILLAPSLVLSLVKDKEFWKYGLMSICLGLVIIGVTVVLVGSVINFLKARCFKDPMLVILLAYAALSLGMSIMEDGVEEGSYDGLSILFAVFLAVFLVVSVSAVSNFRQARRFSKLSNECGNIRVGVVRDGRRQEVSIFDVVVGDVVCLQIGDQVPADGLFVDGQYSLQVEDDEEYYSSMTGESDYVAVDARRNPFLTSGTKIADGYARMLVTSVGMDTTWGEMMSSISHDADKSTPLQKRIEKLTYSIGKIGMAVAALALVALLVRHFTTDKKGNSVVKALLSIVSDAVTIAVVGIPEVLPLAMTLTLAYSMKRVMADKAMVIRKLPACETMGSVTTICTDKTGTLTLNQMQVTKFWIGEEEVVADKSNTTIVDDRLLELLHQGVGLNTTATVYKSSSSASEPEFSGSPTEKAILSWAVKELGMDAEAQKRRWEILHVEAFNSDKKRSGVVARSKEDEHVINVHWKGAAEMILGMCSHYCNTDGVPRELDAEKRTKAEQIIEGMAASSLRCIAFAYKRQGSSVENYCSGNDDGSGEDGVRKLEDEKLTLLGVVGLKDPCRPGARKAVEACRAAGVAVKMITGDNIFTAKSIAFECGILRADEDDDVGDVDGAVIEGKTFRSWSEEKRMEKVDRIRVMARSSPFDKLLMVQCLKRKHHVVAVTGDGTNDAPALREADVGLSMGVQGTEVAKESSDIVILDDNFASVATVLMWGRCVYSNIQKFIQFQLTVNVAALVINFVAAVSSGEVPLTTVQLPFGVNSHLIMETLWAVALATEKPTEDLAKKPPVDRTAPLITNVMWRNLLAQALFQVVVLLVLQFRGESMFGVGEKVKNTLVFNTFVLCQVFNEFNARRLEKKNVFEGIHKNRLFLGIIAATLILQVLMVEFMRKIAGTERLDWGQWGFCVGIAFLSWPIGWAFKWVPVGDKPISRLFKF